MLVTTSTIAIVVPPKAQPIDISGPLGAFREANRQSDKTVFYDVKLLSVDCSRHVEIDGMTVTADFSINDVDFDIDTLLVAGTHDYRQAFQLPDFQNWLSHHAPKSRRYGSVCTGAFFLGEAGLLNGRKVTTHWQQVEELAARYPEAEVLPDSIYIQDGPLCTSAGITAGIDLTLKLIEDDYGRELAMKVARQLVVFLQRPGGQSQFSAHLAAQTATESRIQAIQHWILDNLTADMSLTALASKVAMSVRNFSRVFQHEAGRTPADFVESARVDAARRLLEDSDAPLQKVATACGFSNPEIMRRTFIRRIGVSPSDYRSRFR
ncbi:MAG: GlxA family transcriptional regulator [Methylophaga sp.]